MKKNYIVPSLQPMDMGVERMVAASIKNIGGNSGIGLGNDDVTPTEADVNANPFGESLFD
jgi:hypothetical protein